MCRRRISGVALLLEAIIGIGLFAMAAIMLLGILTAVSQASVQAREMSLALQIARDEITKVRSRSFDVLGSAIPNAVVTVESTQAGTRSLTDFTVATTITPLGVGATITERTLVVRVSWKRGEVVRDVALESRVYRF